MNIPYCATHVCFVHMHTPLQQVIAGCCYCYCFQPAAVTAATAAAVHGDRIDRVAQFAYRSINTLDNIQYTCRPVEQYSITNNLKSMFTLHFTVFMNYNKFNYFNLRLNVIF